MVSEEAGRLIRSQRWSWPGKRWLMPALGQGWLRQGQEEAGCALKAEPPPWLAVDSEAQGASVTPCLGLERPGGQ